VNKLSRRRYETAENEAKAWEDSGKAGRRPSNLLRTNAIFGLKESF
jgi:hypothetical protein